MTMNGCSWHCAPLNLNLSSGEVHVFKALLDPPPESIPGLQKNLSTDELDRAERFYFPEDRFRFIAARGILRKVLGRYLDMDPAQLRFLYGVHGKPELAFTSGPMKLKFNLSHSGGLGLYAFAFGREIGIDLQHIRVDFDYKTLAARCLTAGENASLQSLPVENQPKTFFEYWALKEAYIKGRGEGLSLPLNQFEVSLRPDKSAKLVNMWADPLETSRWSLLPLSPGHDYAAALAVEGHRLRLACWQWQG